MMTSRNNKAFTLLELILTTLIISIIALVSTISVRKHQIVLEKNRLSAIAESVFRLSENALALEKYKCNVVDEDEISIEDAKFLPDCEKEYYKGLDIMIFIDDGRVVKVTCQNKENEQIESFPADNEGYIIKIRNIKE